MPPEFEGQCAEMAGLYRSLTVSSLTTAGCTTPQPHIIEALTLHLYAEYASVADLNLGVWTLLATIIRLAMRMGYHRNRHSNMNVCAFQVRIRCLSDLRYQ